MIPTWSQVTDFLQRLPGIHSFVPDQVLRADLTSCDAGTQSDFIDRAELLTSFTVKPFNHRTVGRLHSHDLVTAIDVKHLTSD